MSNNYHAVLSPSGSSKWTVCTAAPGAEDGKPNPTSDASRRGTCGHQIGEELLKAKLAGQPLDPSIYVGRVMGFPVNSRAEDWLDKLPKNAEIEHEETADEDLVSAMVGYANFVWGQKELLGAELVVEERVPIDHITGEEGASGSQDVGLLPPLVDPFDPDPEGQLLIGIDLKCGRGKVYAYEIVEPAGVDFTGDLVPPVYRMNTQVAMYLLGMLRKFGDGRNIKRVKAIIVQPFVSPSISEYECSIEELLELGRWLSQKAEETRTNPQFVPGTKQCFFCRARFDCAARNAEALKTAVDGFDDVDSAEAFAAAPVKPIFVPELGQLHEKLPMIRKWCDDIESKLLDELDKGTQIVGSDGQPMKLVEGRRPPKEWTDDGVAESLMNRFRLGDLMWNKKIISPTQAEKLAPREKKKKDAPEVETPIGPTQWKRLAALVTQRKGKPVPAPGSDPRPALSKDDDMPEEEYDLFA